MTKYLAGKKLTGQKYFPLVLMLEPLHRCNLHCSGCGRIREYADALSQEMSVKECIDAVKECNAPIVSICGGEPLIYRNIVELVERIVHLGKYIYLCTNGQVLAEKISNFEEVSRQAARHLKRHLFWNVHLDGTAEVHDNIVEKDGAFVQAVRGILAAKQHGFRVYTNTTLYRQTKLENLLHLAEALTAMKIDGMMIAPGYSFSGITGGEDMFLTRAETHKIFGEIRQRMKRHRLTATPVFFDFLCGKRELPCATWANPTRNIKGWKSPCYLITDTHYATYGEWLQKTDWTKIGRGKDERCENCLMHCGYEPAAVLFGNRFSDLLRTAVWQLW